MTLPNAESFLYWQSVKFGLKPTIRINHLTIANQQSRAVVVSKMLYASHYFWTAIELRVLVPDPARGEGFWFANVNRSRSDGLDGFVGSLIRGKVRDEAEQGMQAALAITKNGWNAEARVVAAVKGQHGGRQAVRDGIALEISRFSAGARAPSPSTLHAS